MNWTAIGAIGEVLGALAVFLTLLYLAMQIRASTKVAKSTVRQHITETIMRVGENVASNTELARAWMEQYDGEVEPHRELQLQAFAYSTMRSYENIQFQMNNGMLTLEEWRGFEGNLKALLALPYFRRYWEAEKHLYRQEFREVVDVLITQEHPESSIVDPNRFRRQDSGGVT